MSNNYQFLDAYGSVLTAASTDVAGAQQPIINIAGSVITVGGTAAANQSVSGTVNLGPTSVTALQGTNPWVVSNTSVTVMSVVPHSVATLQSTNPWIVVGSIAVVSAVPTSVAALQGTNPWQMTGSVAVMSVVPHSVAALQSTNPWNMVGSVAAYQAGTWATSVVGGPLNLGSILGTYAEDTGHTDGNPGLFTLGVRNDTTASFVSANLDYTPVALDSTGRILVKPFAADYSSIFGTGSVNGAASVIVIAAPGTGLRNYITDIMVANTGSVGTLVRFTAGGASILGFTIAPAGGGSNLIGFATPIATQTNSPFNIAADTASSVVYATAYGYRAP